jgi:hypothetical protein
LKEHILYAKEAEEQQRKVDKLIANNAEEWDVKSAVRDNQSFYIHHQLKLMFMTIRRSEKDIGRVTQDDQGF